MLSIAKPARYGIYLVPAAIAAALGCAPSQESSSLRFVATIEPLVMILSELTGDRAEVVRLLPRGASPHAFALRPSTAREAESSLGLFYVDESLDGWAATLPAEKKFAVFKMLSSGSKAHEDAKSMEGRHAADRNPHFWTDPTRVQALLPYLVEALIESDPEGSDIYRENGLRFADDLDRLHHEIETLLEPIEGRSVVVFHPSWSYFLERYGIETAAEIESSPGKEATARHLKTVIDAAEAHAASAILTEPQLPSRPAEAIAEATGLALLELDPLGGAEGPRTYAEWLRDSAHRLLGALQ